MRIGVWLLIILAVVKIAACSLITEDKKSFRTSTQSTNYLQIDERNIIQIPDELAEPRFIALYPVPQNSQEVERAGLGKKFKVPPPKALEIIWDAQKVQLRRKGQRQWIRLNAKPAQVWNILHTYLDRAALHIVNEDARAGVIETQWVRKSAGSVLFEMPADSDVYRKLRIRIERGRDPDISNIYVAVAEDKSASPRVASQVNKINWSTSEALLPQVERILQDLHDFLKKQDLAEDDVSLAGQDISSEPLSEVTWLDGKVTLKLRQDFNYGWKQIGEALSRGAFPVEDLNRSQGLFYIRLADSRGDANSFYKQLRKSSKLEQEALGSGLIILKVSDAGRYTQVFVEGAEGVLLSHALQESILSNLKESLE